MAFKGLLLEKTDAGFLARHASLNEADLPPGEVLIRVSHSSLNYKDALGIHNRPAVIRRFPIVAGIDVAGIVESSTDARWQPGDAVLVTGFGLGETQKGDWKDLMPGMRGGRSERPKPAIHGRNWQGVRH